MFHTIITLGKKSYMKIVFGLLLFVVGFGEVIEEFFDLEASGVGPEHGLGLIAMAHIGKGIAEIFEAKEKVTEVIEEIPLRKSS